MLEGHGGAVFHAEFSADGRRVVTSSLDHTARVWDVESGAELHKLEGHSHSVNHAEFSPDGQRVLTASDDRTARVYTLNVQELADLARKRLCTPAMKRSYPEEWQDVCP